MNGHDQAVSAHAALVDRARRGEEAAWRELVTRHAPALRAVTRRFRLRETDAADVVQTTWLRCLENLAVVRDPDCLPAWLVTTCRRECLRLLRRTGREIPNDTTDAGSLLCAVPDPAPDGFARASHREDTLRLYAAVDDLPRRQRYVVLELMHRGEDGYAEVADRLGIPIGSLGPTRRRALARLRLDARLQPTA